jgi:hypothetical protein
VRAEGSPALDVVLVCWMAWAEWDRKNELLMKGIRIEHCGGHSDCIWVAFHRTAGILALRRSKRSRPIRLPTLTLRDLQRRHPLVDFR